MTKFTRLDFHNARIYALQHLYLMKMNKFKISHPHVFDHVIVNVRQATQDDYYVPPRLEQKCVVVDLKFNEMGCRKVGCFPYKKGGIDCESNDETQVVRYGNQFTFACQPACFYLFDHPYVLDTKFYNDENKCLLQNFLIKQYALNPQSRLPYTLSVTDDGESLSLNDYYCQIHGLSLTSDGECSETIAQQVGEFFVGSTVYRSLNVAQLGDPEYLEPPAIPMDISTLSEWTQRRRKARSAAQQQFQDQGRDVDFSFQEEEEEEEDRRQFLYEIAKEIAVDVAIDMSISKIARLLQKTVPREIMKKVSVSALALVVTYKTPIKASIRAIKSVGAVVNALDAIYALASVAFMVTDLVDPLKFNKVLKKAQVDRISKYLRLEFKRLIRDSDRELKPEMVMALIEGEEIDSEIAPYLESKIVEYLNSLDDNAFGQRLEIQENLYADKIQTIFKLEQELQRRSFLVYHFVITSICLTLSLALLPFLKYVVVFYLFFVIFYNHLTEKFMFL